ncbi:MAG: hypothetical protein C4317_09165, partial [Acidimicrobiia bacterium]
GSRHTEMEGRPPTPSDISNLIWYLDEPLADSSAIPQFLISTAAAEKLKVVISGDGGDELFGGYLKHHHFSRFWRAQGLRLAASLVPASSFRVLAMTEARLERSADTRSYPIATTTKRLRRAVHLYRMREVDAYLDFLAAIPSFERASVVGDAFPSRLSSEAVGAPISELLPEITQIPAGLGILWRAGLVDALTGLPGDILVKIDRMSMANSLEIRSPLLDRSIIEWAFSLPDTVRRRQGETKPLLRDAARLVLPASIAASPKRGFAVPLSEWMRGALGVLTAEVLLDRSTSERGWIRRSYAEKLLAQNLAGLDMGPRLWQLLVLELWARAFIDSSPPDAPAL